MSNINFDWNMINNLSSNISENLSKIDLTNMYNGTLEGINFACTPENAKYICGFASHQSFLLTVVGFNIYLYLIYRLVNEILDKDDNESKSNDEVGLKQFIRYDYRSYADMVFLFNTFIFYGLFIDITETAIIHFIIMTFLQGLRILIIWKRTLFKKLFFRFRSFFNRFL